MTEMKSPGEQSWKKQLWDHETPPSPSDVTSGKENKDSTIESIKKVLGTDVLNDDYDKISESIKSLPQGHLAWVDGHLSMVAMFIDTQLGGLSEANPNDKKLIEILTEQKNKIARLQKVTHDLFL